MSGILRSCVALVALAFAAPAASLPEAAAVPPQTIVLKVGVDAGGRVQTTASLDPAAAPALLQAAEAYARKLVFTPARKGGSAVPSETYLSLVLAMEPAGEGKYALKLRRAVNGPGVASLGKLDPPKNLGRRAGATIVVAVDVDAQGKPDMDSFKAEKVELREPSSFAEARYLDAIRQSVRHSRFDPDKVAGVPVASRVSLPYRFGMGGAKAKPGEDEGGRGKKPMPGDPTDQPTMQGVSLQPDIELPKLDYKSAPAA
jgi:hypothetical protein